MSIRPLTQRTSSFLSRQKILILIWVIVIWNLPISLSLVYFNGTPKSLNSYPQKCRKAVYLSYLMGLEPWNLAFCLTSGVLQSYCWNFEKNSKILILLSKKGRRAQFPGEKLPFRANQICILVLKNSFFFS